MSTSTLKIVQTRSQTPSLLRFLQDRLREEAALILENTPLAPLPDLNPDFEHGVLGRGALLNKQRTHLAIIALLSEAMEAEQGSPPTSAAQFVPGPVTILGSEIIKLLAALYGDHPDYRPEWRPGDALPMA